MAVCQICGKGPQFGNKVARLGRNAVKRRVKARVKRVRQPNVQRIAVWVNGGTRHMYACTGCIRSGRVMRPPERRHDT